MKNKEIIIRLLRIKYKWFILLKRPLIMMALLEKLHIFNITIYEFDFFIIKIKHIK